MKSIFLKKISLIIMCILLISASWTFVGCDGEETSEKKNEETPSELAYETTENGKIVYEMSEEKLEETRRIFWEIGLLSYSFILSNDVHIINTLNYRNAEFLYSDIVRTEIYDFHTGELLQETEEKNNTYLLSNGQHIYFGCGSTDEKELTIIQMHIPINETAGCYRYVLYGKDDSILWEEV